MNRQKIVAAIAVSFVGVFFFGMAKAQLIEVKEAWIRGTVAEQKVTGAFMDITAKVNAKLLSVSSPIAQQAQIHSMKETNGVMKMFQTENVELPKGKTVKFAPGGYHVMLMGLKHPLKAGQKVPMTLTVQPLGEKKQTIALMVEVRDITGAPPLDHSHHEAHSGAMH
jgi:copper(I)-binding protein